MYGVCTKITNESEPDENQTTQNQNKGDSQIVRDGRPPVRFTQNEYTAIGSVQHEPCAAYEN